jgi:hypothetical protein
MGQGPLRSRTRRGGGCGGISGLAHTDRDTRTVAAQMTTHAQPSSGLTLLFEPQARPAVDDLAALIAHDALAARTMSISHCPGEQEGWVEVLCRGLTFDITGLAPARADPAPDVAYRFDLADQAGEGEAVTVHVGQHLTGGDHLLPVVRAHVELGLALLALPGVRALVWRPAEIAMSPRHFRRVVEGWLGGGPFPALGLTYVLREEDGAMRSHGLSFFTGQDVRIEPLSGQNPAALGKIVLRLVHRLVEGGRIEAAGEITGPDGQVLSVEPSDDGHILRVWGKV